MALKLLGALESSGGNVGIGTASPDSKLHIEGSTDGAGAGADAILHVKQNGGWNANQPWALYVEGYSYLNGFRINAADGIRALHKTTSGGQLGFSVTDTAPITFTQSNSTERMRVHSNGNVGIGTTSPTNKLHVSGGSIKVDGNAADQYFLEGVRTGVGTTIRIYDNANTAYIDSYNNMRFRANQNGGSGGVFSFTGGNVGIGSAAPAAKLNVASTGANAYSATITKGTNMKGIINALSNNADDMVGIYFGTGTTSEGTHWSGITGSRSQSATDWSTQLNFYTHNEDVANINDATQKMVIKGNGNVGIGTTSPTHLLTLETASSPGIKIKDTTQGNTLLLFSQDSDSHVGTYSSHPLVFDTNSTERMRITSAGNVGIGTTSPAAQLQIDTPASNSAGQGLRLNRPSAGTNYHSVEFATNGTVDWSIGQNSNDAFEVYENGAAATTRLTIKEGGNVGIGTTSPAKKLDVRGGYFITSDGGTNEEAFVQGGNGYAYFGNYSTGKAAFGNSENWTTLVADGGNVGIGTTSPSNLLHIHASGNNASALIIEDDDRRLQLGRDMIEAKTADGSSVANLYIQPNGNTAFATTTGNVGIGTTSPGTKLEVSGSTQVITIRTSYPSDSSQRGAFLWKDGANITGSIDTRYDGTTVDMYFGSLYNSGYNSTTRLVIKGNGNVGIGTASPSEKLHVVGDTRIEGNLTVNGTYTQIDTDTNTTEQWNVTNDGTGPAVTINQTGAQDIMDVQDDGTSVFYIEDGGNVGIGTTNPGVELDVAGGIRATAGTANGLRVHTNSGITASSNYMNFFTSQSSGWAFNANGTGADSTTKVVITSGGNVGIGNTSPAAPLDVQPASNYKVTKVGDDTTSHYKFTGQADHTLTLASGSYYSAEVVITAHQTNGATNNNLYIRGIWTNNHTSHHWHEIENIGSLSGSSFTITNGQSGDTTNSGELEIVHDYTSGSFGQMVVRVTEHYGTHSYTIS